MGVARVVELHEQALEFAEPGHGCAQAPSIQHRFSYQRGGLAGELAPERFDDCVNLGVQGDGGGLRQNHFLESRIFLHMSNEPSGRAVTRPKTVARA